MNLSFELDEFDVQVMNEMDTKFVRTEKCPEEHKNSKLRNVSWLSDTSYQTRLSEIETITISTDMEEVLV